MSRVGDKNSQLVRWLNRLFPPSAPRYSQPVELVEQIGLTMPALPPSLAFDAARAVFRSAETINPSTGCFFPGVLADGFDRGTNGAGPGIGVPKGQFMWVHGCDWYQGSGVIVGAAGFAFIRVRPANAAAIASGQGVTVGAGVFETTDALARVFTHAVTINSSVGFGGGTVGGGGVGGFIVPEGCEIHFSTGSTPGATTVFRADFLFTLMDIGELFPPIG